MQNPLLINSLSDLQESFFVLIPAQGRAQPYLRSINTPTTLDELKELLADYPNNKFYKDKKRESEIIFRLSSRSPRPTTVNLQQSPTVSDRRQYFLAHAIPDLHYVAADNIRNLYDDEFKEAVVRKLLLEVTSESRRSLDANLAKFVTALAADQDIVKLVAETAPSQLSEREMLKRYIQHGVKGGKIDIGLEVLDRGEMKLSALEKYDKEIARLREKWTLLDSQVEENRKPEKRKVVSQVIDRLNNAGSWVLISADFLISQPTVDLFTFEYIHPASSFWGSDIKIVLRRVPRCNFLNDYAEQYSHLIGQSKTMNIFGTVFHNPRGGEPYDIVVTPYAIF